MTRPNTDHVVVVPDAFECLHCEARHVPDLPMQVEQFLTVGRGFALMHRLCPKPVEPSKQVALFDELAKKESEDARFERTCPGCMRLFATPAERLSHQGGCTGIDAPCDCDLPPGTPHDCTVERKADRPISFIDDADVRGIDGNTDDPDPETDPPGPDPFALAYPMARDHEKLRADLAVVLQGVLVPTREQLGRHHPSTGVFDAIAHWTRLELARMNRESHPDLDIPTPLPMPEKLAEMRTELGAPAKKKRGARPLSSPKKGKG